MALHELATNAAKYGALSATGGSIEISWDIAPSGREIRLKSPIVSRQRQNGRRWRAIDLCSSSQSRPSHRRALSSRSAAI